MPCKSLVEVILLESCKLKSRNSWNLKWLHIWHVEPVKAANPKRKK
uniref:Uncharacterized protein n=1 Tax=Rhizophora mucronata TaxID=61149 RepID=A0A2P2LQP0_RHIMU